MHADDILDVKLHHVAVSASTVWSFVALHLADQTVGWGEATLVGKATLLTAHLASARRAVVGLRLSDLGAWRQASLSYDMGQAAIASALEQAALDARGQQVGLSAVALLGGCVRDSVPVYANINRRTVDRSSQGFFQSATDAIAAGYTTLKIAPFDGVTPATASSPSGRALTEAGLQRIAATKAAARDTVQVYVDCHWRFDEAAAGVALNEVAAMGVTWFECPLPESRETMAALRRLRTQANALGVRLAGLESLTHPDAFIPWLQAGCYDVVMPDVKYAGGISGVVRVGKLAAQNDTVCAPHNPTGPLCHAASLIACGVGPHMAQLEHQYDETPLFGALVNGGLPNISHGQSALPSGPGLGVRLSKALMDQLATVPEAA